jgi:kynurenine 3-monooxygenase
MRDHTGSRRFRWKKKRERMLHRLLPRWYVPLYSMATFTRMPYLEAMQKSKRQERVVAGVFTLVGLVAIVALIGLLR